MMFILTSDRSNCLAATMTIGEDRNSATEVGGWRN